MKKTLICIAILFAINVSHAQETDAAAMVREGIVLHDKGDYEAAIQKYDEAIAKDGNYVNAYYEKAYSLHSLKKMTECIELCQATLARFKDAPERKMLYMVYGNCLDDMKESDKAIEVYDEGIRQYPGYYLLYFNRGITLSRLNRAEEALTAFQKAISYNPAHASSHKSICLMLRDTNKIPSLMAGLIFLCYEPTGDRAAQVLETVKSHFSGNAKKDGENRTTITLNVDDLDIGKKKEKKENNFSMVALLLTLTSSLDNDSTIQRLGVEAALGLKIQMLANSLKEQKKDGRGFFWNVYAPFIIDMKKDNQVETFAHIALANDQAEDNKAWLSNHKEEVAAFFEWVKGYKWKPQ